MRSATSLGRGLPSASLQVRCTSSCSRRSIFAWPFSRKDALMTSSALAVVTSSCFAMPAHPAAASNTSPVAMSLLFMSSPQRLRGREAPSSFNGRRVERAAVGILREERGERDRSRRDELQLRKALLAEAIVEPPLERAHLALRHAVGRPRRVGTLCIGALHEVGKVLQANALVVRSMAGDAAEVVRPA